MMDHTRSTLRSYSNWYGAAVLFGVGILVGAGIRESMAGGVMDSQCMEMLRSFLSFPR